jgi:thiol:disulfide interchange protein DsbD
MKKILLLPLLCWSLFASFVMPVLAADEELLPAEQAFQLSTRVIDANTLEASWAIAKGYYLYRDKFKFDVISGDARLLEPRFPKAKVKEDPLFGKVETYLTKVAVALPLERTQGKAGTVRLRITAQGCNEPVGVCYPPMINEVDFALPAAASGKVDSLSSLKKLVQPGGGDEQEFLPPEQAFGVDVTSVDGRTLNAFFRVADGYYLYRDKLAFELKGASNAQLGAVELPKGKIKEDPLFGKVEVYTRAFDARLPVAISSADAATAVLTIKYQGCAERGICYPPASQTINVAIAGGAASVNGGAPAIAGTSSDGGAAGVSTREYLLAILSAFGVGLILTFTPCVLPMIPILSSIIVGSGGEKITRMRGGVLAMTYVLGTAVTYTIAGAVAGATGEQLQAYFQNVWAIGIFAALLALLSLSMFGFYEIQMPSFIQSRLSTRSQQLKSGSFIGVLIMGMISALIVGACVSPLLISALAVAIASKDALLGGLIMFSMSMGMGVVLIALGFGAGFLVPKAGPWMDRVKYFFGVLLLGVAVYLLGVLPQVPVLFLWAALLIVTSIYLGALEPLPAEAGGWNKFFKGIGLLMLVWGVFAVLGGFSGNRDILRPIDLSGTAALMATGIPAEATQNRPAVVEHVFEQVRNENELDARLAAARAAGKPVVLDFFATWCTDCVRMEKTTFTDAGVQQVLQQRFVALQIDVTDPNDAATKAIKKRFGVFGPPAFLFIDASGKERKDLNFYGYKPTDAFLSVLDRI